MASVCVMGDNSRGVAGGASLTAGKSKTGPREGSLDQVTAQGDESLSRD